MTSAPDWFQQAVAVPREDRFTEVHGCRIHYLRWGATGKPGLLLVHGSGAHAHWWDFIAPFFTEQYCVAAIDLGGMGDSGHRAQYSSEMFVREVIGVCADAGFGDNPILIGHSFGGYVALKTGLVYGKNLTGAVLVDAPVRPPDYDWERVPKLSPMRLPNPSAVAAIAAMRLASSLPESDCAIGRPSVDATNTPRNSGIEVRSLTMLFCRASCLPGVLTGNLQRTKVKAESGKSRLEVLLFPFLWV